MSAATQALTRESELMNICAKRGQEFLQSQQAGYSDAQRRLAKVLFIVAIAGCVETRQARATSSAVSL